MRTMVSNSNKNGFHHQQMGFLALLCRKKHCFLYMILDNAYSLFIDHVLCIPPFSKFCFSTLLFLLQKCQNLSLLCSASEAKVASKLTPWSNTIPKYTDSNTPLTINTYICEINTYQLI